MTTTIPFKRDMEFTYGKMDQLSPLIRRVIAHNPSPFTFYGTGTYILGEGNVMVIDPGPADEQHINNLLEGLSGETISHILVTHTHLDHSPGCRLLQQHCDAKTYAFGPHGSGKHEKGETVEQGADFEFTPDVLLRDQQIIEGEGYQVECVHTPGHTSNHMCFQLVQEKALFTGDHVMGWSTSVISPPDGDMAAYMESLNRLLERNDSVYWPTHGPCITDTKSFVKSFIAHREERERQILKALQKGKTRIAEMVPEMYQDIPEQLYPAAARSVLASLIYLIDKEKVVRPESIALDTRFEPV